MTPTPLKVLIAEDHDTFGAMVASIVRASLGCDVGLAPTVSQALAELETSKPDLLITDLRFGPSHGGLDLIRAVRNHRRFAVQIMPILVISAAADVPTVRRARALGVDAFLSKPISPTLLVERLAAMTAAAARTVALPVQPIRA